MKYMGSKRMMLRNGLGEILATEAESATRFVDLFCGSGAVSWYSATELGKPVLACDLQSFATTLAGAVIKRTQPIHADVLENRWMARAVEQRTRLGGWTEAKALDDSTMPTEVLHRRAQKMCASHVASESTVIWDHYGGHYFSPTQALSFDAMLLTLPADPLIRELCLAATIMAASRCAAAPGHTAQPFKATKTAAKYLRHAWRHDPVQVARHEVERLRTLYAATTGRTAVVDANEVAATLGGEDLVFVDPPYSSVQYSRFYHVLETISRGGCGPVDGVGRYPPQSERPNSRYSKKQTSGTAIRGLLSTLSERRCTVVLTFPVEECSNGLSGFGIEMIASKFFCVSKKVIRSRFNTLGGNLVNRSACRVARELILVLKSK